jgi:hypothetical protein
MQTFIEKYNIQEEFNSLPITYQQALLSTNWEEAVWGIAKKQGLMLDETTVLIEEVGLVLFGGEKSSNLGINLSKHTKLLDKEIEQLIRELNVMIFIPLQDKMRQLSKTPSEQDLLSEIEDKSKPQTETVTHKKLADIFTMVPAKSDYSVDKPVKPVSYEGDDPYHEPID